jgi:predicted phosphodiesterase
VKIQLLSDLHLESQPQFLPHQLPRPAPGADLLVLAGDIGSYQTGSKLTDADFGLAPFSPLHGWPTPVVFVPGNHEYDGLDFDAAHARLRATCARLQIGWLEREVMFGPWTDRHGLPVRLLGTTLWTDFDALGPQADAAPKARTGGPSAGENLLAQQLKAREKAFRAANFYLKKASTTRHSAPFLAAEIRAQAITCQDWLRHALDTPFEGSTVVVTHFAPSLRSADPRYGLVPGTAGFCSALDDMLLQAQLWLHGHLHAPQDYVHQGCRVVANPLGYARKNEQAFFQPSACIEM